MLATFTHLIGPKKGDRERFDGDRILVGRAPDNTLRFSDNDRRVSAHHAEIIRKGDHYILRDLGSTNGTIINGRRVRVSEIHSDDLIEFGPGGPLVRFNLERERESFDSGARTAAIKRTEKLAAGYRKGNLTLILSIVLSMVTGAVATTLFSGRLNDREKGLYSFSEIAALNSPAVVFVRAEYEIIDSGGNVVAREAQTGSGFVISAEGLIVTNRHLVRHWEYDNATAGMTGNIAKIEVLFPRQTRDEAVEARIESVSSGKEPDVALLRISGDRLPTARSVETDLTAVSQGEEVAAIGYPLGLDLLERTGDERIGPSMSTGIVSRVGQDYIQLNLRAFRGNSGGPVLNRKGQVIGIVTASIPSAQDLILCTPVARAIELLNRASVTPD
jgi:S1-C subfamily serine protease